MSYVEYAIVLVVESFSEELLIQFNLIVEKRGAGAKLCIVVKRTPKAKDGGMQCFHTP